MIYVLSGGQTGAILTVTSSGAGTITVSNTSLGKSYSKSVTAGGSAVFKGLATGTWTVQLSNGTQTSTKTITITSDYSTSIAYFSATISITYPATSTCVVTNSDGQTVASDTNTGSSTKTWTATVGATGTYTVAATATDGSGKTKSTTVSITADGQSSSVTLSYELVLFDNGTYAAETGGWKGISGNYLVASVSGVATGQTGLAAFYTNNKVDLTGYSTLHFTIEAKSGDENYDYPIGASANTGTGRNDFAASTKIYNSAVGTTVTVDISSLSTSYYIRGVVYSNGNGSYGSLKVSKVWLT